MTIRTTTLPSPLGPLRLTDHGRGLSGLYFAEHRHAPSPEGWQEDAGPFETALAQLRAYLEGRHTDLDLPLDLRGTELQREVWSALRAIPFGEVTTYGEVARRVGRPSSARAVAAAIGRNPVAIVVPCHRVVAADGALTGYAGGLDRKRWLLHHEGAAAVSSAPRPG